MLLTGATGAVGSAVARKLLKCGLRKLVLMVRDREDLDPKIKEDRCDLAGCHTIIARGLRPIPAYLFTVRDPENVDHQIWVG